MKEGRARRAWVSPGTPSAAVTSQCIKQRNHGSAPPQSQTCVTIGVELCHAEQSRHSMGRVEAAAFQPSPASLNLKLLGGWGGNLKYRDF